MFTSAKLLTSLSNHPPIIDIETTVDWIKSGKHPTYYIFNTEPIKYKVDTEILWQQVKKLDDYHMFSQGAITATLKGELKRGTELELKLYKNKFGIYIPKVTAVISIVDDEKKIIGWSVKLPFGKYTERYHLLSDEMSFVTDGIPGLVGYLSRLFYKKKITTAFKLLNEGLIEETKKISRNKI